MKKILQELLQIIKCRYNEDISVETLIQDLYAVQRITKNELEMAMNGNIKSSKYAFLQLFDFLMPKSDETICDLQRICQEHDWSDVNSTIQEYLHDNNFDHLIVEKKKTPIPIKPNKKPDYDKFYEVELDVYKEVPPTCGIIENLNVEFVDSPPSCDKNTYENFSKPKGMALIINNRKFDNDILPERKGTDVDAKNIGTLFDKLDYTVKIKENLKSHEILEKMNEFAKKSEHKKCHSAVVVILTHGSRDTVYGTDNNTVPVEDIVARLNNINCPDLIGKPKIFIIQACRGENHDFGQECTDFGQECTDSAADTLQHNPKEILAHLDAVDVGSFKKIPSGADILIAYATTPGYVSWRNLATGSWFIQAICEVFQKKAKDEEILHLFTEVNRLVAERFSKSGYVQIPSPCSQLTKKFYFYPGYSAGQLSKK